MIGITLVNADKVKSSLKLFGQNLSPKVLRASFKRTGRDLSKAMRTFTPLKYRRFKPQGGYGFRVKVSRNVSDLKVGSRVGIKSSRWNEIKTKRLAAGRATGVGAELHWYILGTKERKTKSGSNRGRINPVIDPVGQAKSLANLISAEYARKELEREVKKQNAKK